MSVFLPIQSPSSSLFRQLLPWVLLAIIFACDSLTQLGFAHGTLYPPLVLLTLFTRRVSQVLAITVAAVLLTLLGVWISPPSPPGFEPLHVIFNRLLAVAAIVISAMLAVALLRYTIRLEGINDHLRRSRRELDESMALLAIASETGRLGGWSIDVESAEVRWSPEVNRIYQVAADSKFSFQEGLDQFGGDDRQRLEAALARCMADGLAFDDEFHLRRPEGSELWLRIIGRAELDDERRPARVLGAVQDITPLKDAEETLVRSERHFRQLAEAVPMIVWTARPDGRTEFASKALFDYAGLSADTPLFTHQLASLNHPEDQPRSQEAWQRAMTTGEPFSIELRLRRYDGVYRWHLLRARLVVDEKGQPFKWYGTTLDVDDERRRALEFEALAQRLSQTLESITDGFFTIDREWRFTFLNREAEKITGLKQAEVLGQSLWEVLPEARGTVFDEQCRRAMTNQQPVSFETYYEPLELWVDVRAYPSQEGLAIYFHDNTEARKLQSRSREAQRMEAVGHLTGGLAHDFNNLLTVILGNGEILRDTLPVESSLHGLADMVVNAAERGADLTQRLLAFARRQPLAPQKVDVNRLIGNFEPLLRRTLGGHVDIEWVRSPSLWPALVDPSQLENALLNLAINARDAMPGGGRLTIETANARLDEDYTRGHEGLEPGRYVMMAVSDTGTGIEPENLSRVFEPFFTTKAPGKGTGLGLSTIFGFVKQSGGHVAIYSESGEGTTVRMYLPRTVGLEHSVNRREDAEEADTAKGETILLVEDDAMVRDYAVSVLAGAGYNILIAEDGVAGLSLIRKREDIDLLFTDVVMPGGVNGRQLADQATLLRPGLRVLYTSGYTENAIVHHGRLDAGLQLLTKPYRRGELLRKVRQALDET